MFAVFWVGLMSSAAVFAGPTLVAKNREFELWFDKYLFDGWRQIVV